jgi:O-antigen/teichoic acid export membrane protein
MTLRDRLSRKGAIGIGRAVAVLVGGTALGHAVTAAAMPVLTRVYTPADFGMLAVFSAVFSILTVAVCLRYEIAITLPQCNNEAINLLAVAVVTAVGVSGLIALTVLPWATVVASWLGQPDLSQYLWMLPLATLMAGVYAPLQYWLVRQRQYGTLARTRIGQSVAASGSQIGLGVIGVTPFGLLIGPLVNSLAGCIGVIRRMLRHDRAAFRDIRVHRMWEVARVHSDFPRFSTTEALANSASIQLPIMLIAALGSSAEAGHLMLAMFVVQAPMALLGNAVSQVYLSRAPEELRAGRLGCFTAQVIGELLKTGAGPLMALGIVSPLVFAPLFGEEWAPAGVMTAWLTPWFMAHFLAAPVSMALHVAGRQRLALALQLFGLALRVGAVLMASLASSNFLTEAYAVSGLVLYLAYLAIILRVTESSMSDLILAVLRAAPICTIWVASACVATLLINISSKL